MNRLYTEMLKSHFLNENKMILLSGPRQVGKTTSSRQALPDALYCNWDVPEHRKLVLRGPDTLFERMGGRVLSKKKPCIIFDEIHKFPRWKNFLKGFYDLYGESVCICVTGSARLSAFRYGGDSLMGRYFPFRMHPLTVRETVSQTIPEKSIQAPREISGDSFERLLQFGGFPEPFFRSDRRFYNRWKRLRLELLFTQDLRDLTHISDIGRMQMLADLLNSRSGGLVNYSHLANDLHVSVDTIRRWIDTLEELYYCFRIRPWSKKVARSLQREPKVFLWDWSTVSDPGARTENFVAAHLLKAAHFLTDMGFGTYELFFVRDKEKREVDFVMVRDQKPWFLAEVKMSNPKPSPALNYFQKQLDAPHAFQVVLSLPYVKKDCFSLHTPVAVPAKTFLSQLV